MPLIVANLEASLAAFFNPANLPVDATAAATSWAAAYASYASTATDCSGGLPVPISIAGAQALLQTTLESIFSAGVGGLATNQLALQFANALQAFWLTPPIAFATGGIVTIVAGTAVLAAALEALWIASSADQNFTFTDAARDNALLLDTFTKTVTVAVAAIPCASPIV